MIDLYVCLQIHCGNNVYISKTAYDNAKVKILSRNDYSKFVKDISVTIVGIENLKNCSVTGRKCNRKKDAIAKPKLDPVYLNAVYG